ncbi:DUF309 domain-containing protein [Paenibacillus protaetiae]|uniref:DUF309 domain-containing protein n=1 Tax=Paenibacillus protaetiae TaxID=2509456 RepID=A0A4P6ESH3_9BACL|nr:DUF309 domain-containing protein [Paenibacillus protaetiae]QAY66070.1 DUF309 domain-containing protein [Paenibacillus protaetiae]
MQYPSSYIAYLVEFHATRDYFECHELLEEYWKEHPGDHLSRLWVGLIQVAVGSYHERRGNAAGAGKMYLQALSRLNPQLLQEAGIDGPPLLAQLKARAERLESGAMEVFQDLCFSIADHELLLACEALCSARGLVWGKPSDMNSEALIHRHKLRDRSDVIAAREAAIAKKRSKQA